MSHRGRKNADEALALALAIGKTQREAAEEANVSERTVGRRWNDAAFRQRVADLRTEMVSQAVGRLTQAQAAAAERLKALLASASETIALSAARAVLELGKAMRETGDLESRMLEIERRLDEQNQKEQKQ